MKFSLSGLPLALGISVALSSSSAQGQTTNGGPSPIDLPTVLRLAGAQNLDIQIARQQLKEAEANRSSALEQFFPWLAPGVAYHRRDGVAQGVPSGIVTDANYQSYYPGATVAAQMDLGDAIYKSLAAKQLVKASDQALEAQRQDSPSGAALAYFTLTTAERLGTVYKITRPSTAASQTVWHMAVHY